MAWQPQPGQYDSPYSNATPDAPPHMNGLNGFKDHSLDDDTFGAKGSIVSAFDAFRELPPPQVFCAEACLASDYQRLTLPLRPYHSEIQTPICDANLRRRQVDRGHDAHDRGSGLV